MSELMMDLITSAVAVVVGFGLGQIVAWRRAVIGGRPFVVPTAHPAPRTTKIAAGLVILVATVSMVSGLITQAQVENCNEAFRETIKARGLGTSEQFQAITDLQVKLAEAEVGTEGAADRLKARQDYVVEVQAIEEYRAAHPYPDAAC